MSTQINQSTIISSPVILNSIPGEIKDYTQLLDHHQLKYKVVHPYLQIGEITKVQGWIIHISVVKYQLSDLLQLLVAELAKEPLAFKIPINVATAHDLMDGSYGYTQLGKLLCLYPESDMAALEIAQKMIALARDFRGPFIPTDAHLGGCVYVRYGSFNPILLTDENGKTDKYIYDKVGKLTKDLYSTPFKMPKGISWPFSAISRPVVLKKRRILHGYLPYIVLKSDPKGRVIKGINIKGLRHLSLCLIKEGKRDMLTDDSGRDMEDRLLWQEELQRELEAEIPLPRILDSFKVDGDSYLVMEFIEGNSLDVFQSLIFQGGSWLDLQKDGRLLIINNLLEVVSIIEKLHNKGYVHRDITVANFLIDKRGKLYLIDLELAYCIEKRRPCYPFRLGTPGCMSPEQEAGATPTFKEDIYTLGTLLIVSFVRLPPSLLDNSNKEKLYENLYYFVRKRSIVSLILRCLNTDPDLRPELPEINAILQAYRDEINLTSTISENDTKIQYEIPRDRHSAKPNAVILEEAIHRGLLGLTSRLMVTTDGTWSSPAPQEDNSFGNTRINRAFYLGWSEGISGILYLLGKISSTGINIDLCMPVYEKNRLFLEKHYLGLLPNLPSGLYAGAAGMALAFATGIRGGLLDSQRYIPCIKSCLDLAPAGLNIASGAAGQGLSLLHCSSFLDQAWAEEKLQASVRLLSDCQLKDGSWLISRSTNNRKGEKLIGLSHGVAGITLFLLEYVTKYKDNIALNAAKRGLEWLAAQAQKSHKSIFWYPSPTAKESDPYISQGSFGIALTFIRAYEAIREPIYKQIAEAALSSAPEHIIHTNFTQSHGLAGMGEVYLEAFQIFKDEKWHDRAGWITELIVRSALRYEDYYYWLADNPRYPTADLMTGNGGVIHFLIRYLMPGRIRCPLLSE